MQLTITVWRSWKGLVMDLFNKVASPSTQFVRFWAQPSVTYTLNAQSLWFKEFLNSSMSMVCLLEAKCTSILLRKFLTTYFIHVLGTEVLNLGSFTLLPQHVVRLILGMNMALNLCQNCAWRHKNMIIFFNLYTFTWTCLFIEHATFLAREELRVSINNIMVLLVCYYAKFLRSQAEEFTKFQAALMWSKKYCNDSNSVTWQIYKTNPCAFNSSIFLSL